MSDKAVYGLCLGVLVVTNGLWTVNFITGSSSLPRAVTVTDKAGALESRTSFKSTPFQQTFKVKLEPSWMKIKKCEDQASKVPENVIVNGSSPRGGESCMIRPRKNKQVADSIEQSNRASFVF